VSADAGAGRAWGGGLVSFSRKKINKPKPGELLESYVQFVYQTLVAADGKNISVSRRAKVHDTRGNTYNIDVYYEFDVAGVPHRVAIECKDTGRPVERDEAIAFEGKVRDLPSTVGIFISSSGYQPAAEKYLTDHGIAHYSGDELPRFGQVIASMISPVALPSRTAVGQPFWTVMEVKNGETTGTYCCMPHPDRDPTGVETARGRMKPLFPLLYSRRQALRFKDAMYGSSSEVEVRGLEQSSLRFLLLCANREGQQFSIMQPIDVDGKVQFICKIHTAKEVADEYCISDLSDLFDSSPQF
jgi:hypothetical protein